MISSIAWFLMEIGMILPSGGLPASYTLQSAGFFSDTLKIEHPSALAIDADGSYLVSSKEDNLIVRFSSEGKVKAKAGGYGWSGPAFDRLVDIVAPNGLDVYVADEGNHRILRLDRNLNVVSEIPPGGSPGDPAFRYPKSLAVSRQGALYVVDGENARIVKYVNDKIERTFGDVGIGGARLKTPSRVRVSNVDLVYVKDGNDIVSFDSFGNYRATIGGGMFRELSGFTLAGEDLIAVDSTGIYRVRQSGAADTLLVFHSGAEIPVDLAAAHDTIHLLYRGGVIRPLALERREVR